MDNNSRINLGIGRGRGRGRGMTPYTGNQLPHTKPESVFAPSSAASSQRSTPVNQDDSTADPGAGGDTLGNSRLSAEANEFYPRNYKVDSSKVSGDLPAAIPDAEERLPLSEEVVRHLLDIVNAITVEPGSYKSAVQPFLESFGSVLTDSYVLDNILNIIVDQSIVQPNFRYNGARLLNDLSEFLADSKPEFRSALLQRCKKEVDEVVKHFESDPIHLQGVVCFLAELYIQLELKPGTRLRINILGDAVYELLELLVSSAVPENMKYACMTLKLAGFALDQDNSTAMDSLLQSLHKVALSLPTDTHTAAVVDNIEQLRLASWGTSSTAEPSFSVTHSLQQVSLEETEPVFYGPDGIVLTREESTFLQENLAPEMECYEESWFNGNQSEYEYECEGEMNEEEEAAYEEFLRMSENNRK